LRADCTTNKLGRTIERTEYAEYITRNNDRVNKNPEYYRQRQQFIEHQFGTLKRHQHFAYTLMRGKKKVLTEVFISFTMYNLSRSVSILGILELFKRIKAVLLRIVDNLDLRNMITHLREVRNIFNRSLQVVPCGKICL
jgi:hypothetical protein